MNFNSTDSNDTLLLDEEKRLRTAKNNEEEEAKRKAREALLKADWIDSDTIGNESKGSKEKPKIYPIEPALQHTSPQMETMPSGIYTELTDAMMQDTPEGRYLLAEELALVKQAAPEGTEIGVAIHPITGKAEIYACGENLDAKEFEEKLEALLKKPQKVGSGKLPTARDYENAKTSLSPKEQKKLISF